MSSPRATTARWLGAAAALVAAWLVIRGLPLEPWIIAGARAAQGAGAAGVLVTAAAVALLTLCLVPTVPLILACGWLYGVGGAAVFLAGATASAAVGFGLGRALGGRAAAAALLTHPRARALADLAVEGGAATVALVRLAPILPFTPSNAVLGLTGLRTRSLLAGTVLGMAPGAVLYAWAGSLLPDPDAIARGEGLHSRYTWWLVGAAFAAALALGAIAAHRLRRG